MHHKESLTHNPHRAYRVDAATPPCGDGIRLTPVETVHGKKKVDLSYSDPSPENVRRIQEVAARKRDSSKPTTPQAQITGANLQNLETIENFFTEEADQDPKPDDKTFLTQVESTLESRPPSSSLTRKPLPPVSMNHPDYSSTMTLLQLTRADVEEHAKDISAISSILTLPGSIELKRTIAKMFADPKHAEEISRAELDRKEKKYEEDRNKQLQKQAEQLKREREILKQELENFKT
jgi:hypothetical protein|eukprot:CAMPEP_0174294354 /NCGR_PEP_ID=MMETSP0809-20121228/41425_1 /TAXON_ID=73025 ORGANISM="Eutreptiella gymnastica-like, Strain CCMP1594" /NCGR_SAMPLE_ID=MMETSP0809 /ASSEMBLY_ACC=CAM_ASM_000658 /LENGTH=235 /DNA_ID=CAMNT_0015395753 /DNA_START=51 /DNA_END=758 /DNA_ORIENTATION=+